MEDLDKPLADLWWKTSVVSVWLLAHHHIIEMIALYWGFYMRIQNYWRYPGCGPHAAAYLGDGLVAAPSKYGNRITFWNVSDIERPELVADLPDRPDCQSVAFCNGYLMVGSDRGIESMRFSKADLVPVDCSAFAPEVNDFEVAADTVLAVSKRNVIKVVRVEDDGRLIEIGVREGVLPRCHGASREGLLVGVTGCRGDGKVETPLGLFPDAVDDQGRFTDPSSWTLANGGEPSRWYMNISNRIILYRKRAYVATGISRIQDPTRREWLLDPSVTVLNVEHPDAPEFLGNYPCTGSTTCTGLYLDRDRECLIVGSGNIVRRFDIDGDLLHETDSLAFPYGDFGDGYPRVPTIHDVCKTDLICDGLPVFFAGAQATDDLYLFTV